MVPLADDTIYAAFPRKRSDHCKIIDIKTGRQIAQDACHIYDALLTGVALGSPLREKCSIIQTTPFHGTRIINSYHSSSIQTKDFSICLTDHGDQPCEEDDCDIKLTGNIYTARQWAIDTLNALCEEGNRPITLWLKLPPASWYYIDIEAEANTCRVEKIASEICLAKWGYRTSRSTGRRRYYFAEKSDAAYMRLMFC